MHPLSPMARVMASHDVQGRSDPPTDWDNVREATNSTSAQGSDALGRLMEVHRPWILTHLASRFHFKDHELQDVFHDFIEQKILGCGLLGHADPKRGSFRAFLRNALDNFAVSEIRRRKAQKRSPGVEMENLDTVAPSDIPVQPTATPGSSRDLVWAQAVIAGALLDMRNELVRLNRIDIWEVFEGRVLQTILNDEPPLDYTTIIARFNYRSPSQALNVLVTAKRIFRRHLRAVISYYARNESEVDEELARLKWILER
jgi:DNA-directed RNA polymerase specialized sigma24 family protein